MGEIFTFEILEVQKYLSYSRDLGLKPFSLVNSTIVLPAIKSNDLD